MRLIDAEKLLDAYSVFGMANISREDVRDELYDLIDNQPTAYDIDKVVEEITKLRNDACSYAWIYDDEFYAGKADGLEKTLEIINEHLKQRRIEFLLEVINYE